MTDHLRGIGFTDSQLVDSGLGLPTRRGTVVDRFRDRIMFPVLDGPVGQDGSVIGFIGRSLHPDAGTDGAPPKYLNSPDTALHRKAEHLYGAHLLPLAPRATLAIVEGPWDALAVFVAGRGDYAAVSTGGTALTGAHAQALHQAVDLTSRGVIAAFDEDSAGHQASLAAYPLLREVGAWPTYAPGLPGYDPSKLYAELGPDVLRESLDAAATRPLLNRVVDDFLARWNDRLGTAEGQVGAARTLAALLVDVPQQHAAAALTRATQRHGLSALGVVDAYSEALDTRSVAPRGRDEPAVDLRETRPRSAVALAAASFPAALPGAPDAAVPSAAHPASTPAVAHRAGTRRR